jgi:hypothetical protein
MQPKFARSYRITKDGRLSIAPDLAPEWLGNLRQREVYCVPMAWVMSLDLSAGRELEAWYLWNGEEANEEWPTSPSAVRDESDPLYARLRAVMYPGSLQRIGRTCRLSCAGLLRALATQGHQSLWVVPEPTSISIWTHYAFNHHFGTLHET